MFCHHGDVPPTSFDGKNLTVVDTYDSLSRLAQRVNTPSNVGGETYAETYGYDINGFRNLVVDARGNSTTSCYDADYAGNAVAGSLGNLTRVIAPVPAGGNPLVTLIKYDAKNKVVESVSPKGVNNGAGVTCATNLSAAVKYDMRDSLCEVDQSATQADPNGDANKIATSYQYDNLGNLGRVDRATSNSTYESVVDYAYDGLNRARKETQYPQGGWPSTPNGSTTSQTLITQTGHDPVSNRQTLVDPLGQTATFAYDAVDRLTGVIYSDGATPNFTHGYDANGNRLTMGDGSGSTTYSYDELDRLTSVGSPGPRTVGYRYDLDGNRTKLIYPDSTAVTLHLRHGGPTAIDAGLGEPLDWLHVLR